MRTKSLRIVVLVAAAMVGAVFAVPQPAPRGTSSHAPSLRTAPGDENELRVEGERRFRTNCGRCHVAPHKFPPRMMATIIRHMRVRATLTDADMHIILRYMTQ